MDSDDRELQIREVLSSNYYSYILEKTISENIYELFRIKSAKKKLYSDISDAKLDNFVHTIKKDTHTNTLIYHLKQLTNFNCKKLL